MVQRWNGLYIIISVRLLDIISMIFQEYFCIRHKEIILPKKTFNKTILMNFSTVKFYDSVMIILSTIYHNTGTYMIL